MSKLFTDGLSNKIQNSQELRLSRRACCSPGLCHTGVLTNKRIVNLAERWKQVQTALAAFVQEKNALTQVYYEG